MNSELIDYNCRLAATGNNITDDEVVSRDLVEFSIEKARS
jgi:hypothetical protein